MVNGLALFACVALAVMAACGDTTPPVLRIEDARALEALDTTGASAYFTVVNGTERADTLLGVTVDVAAEAHMHSGRMEPIAEIPIPAGGSVALQPGGLHLMLQHLTRKPAAGDTVVLTLIFRHAGAMTVPAPVMRYRDLQP